MSKNTKGWYNESYRHSLARKGVKTKSGTKKTEVKRLKLLSDDFKESMYAGGAPKNIDPYLLDVHRASPGREWMEREGWTPRVYGKAEYDEEGNRKDIMYTMMSGDAYESTKMIKPGYVEESKLLKDESKKILNKMNEEDKDLKEKQEKLDKLRKDLENPKLTSKKESELKKEIYTSIKEKHEHKSNLTDLEKDFREVQQNLGLIQDAVSLTYENPEHEEVTVVDKSGKKRKKVVTFGYDKYGQSMPLGGYPASRILEDEETGQVHAMWEGGDGEKYYFHTKPEKTKRKVIVHRDPKTNRITGRTMYVGGQRIEIPRPNIPKPHKVTKDEVKYYQRQAEIEEKNREIEEKVSAEIKRQKKIKKQQLKIDKKMRGG